MKLCVHQISIINAVIVQIDNVYSIRCLHHPSSHATSSYDRIALNHDADVCAGLQSGNLFVI